MKNILEKMYIKSLMEGLRNLLLVQVFGDFMALSEFQIVHTIMFSL